MMVDVTDIPNVSMGTEVVLIGRQGKEIITADDIAHMSGTIGYEIVCGISKRVPRIYQTMQESKEKDGKMNKILDAVKHHATSKPERIAYTVYDATEDGISTDSLTWKELDVYSDRLSGYIAANTKADTPIVVYGHKNKYMMVCFMACVKSGHAYVPVDVSVPASRVQDIIDSVEPEIVLCTVDEGTLSSACQILTSEKIKAISTDDIWKANEDRWLRPEDTFYIIFTSGSTGKPKGVQITTECLVNYVEWAQNLGGGGVLAA